MIRNLFLGLVLILVSCNHRSKKYWRTEKSKMEACQNTWAYVDLKQETNVKVLLFSKNFRVCASSFPNFIIGVTPNSDTIGIVDAGFEGMIEKNQRVTISPVKNWDGIFKPLMKPCFRLYPNSKDNQLHCIVKTVYYAEVKKIDTK
jgi:hypothetical protein